MINNGIAHRDYTSSATVQVELFRDRLTVFSPGPMHKDMKFEMLGEEHQSYATNPIIAHALYYVKYIEEVGSGTKDIFEICDRTGLLPPSFDVDARHFNVTVYRPKFDEEGNRIPVQIESQPETKTDEVGSKARELGAKSSQLGANPQELGAKTDFDVIMASYRKDFRETCRRVWMMLLKDSSLTQRQVYQLLKLPYSSVQSAYNALKEVGLLVKEGNTKGCRWIVNTMVSS